MNNQEKLDKMRYLRTQETINLLMKKMQDGKIDYKRLSKTDKVLDVKYVGKIELEGEFKDIYAIIEQFSQETGSSIETVKLIKYVTEELQTIAINREDDKFKKAFVTQDFMEDKADIESQINELDVEDPILDLNEMEKEQIEELAKTLGVRPEDIKELDEIDMSQELDIQQKDGEMETITETEFQKLNLKEETNLGQSIKGETLENKLGLKEEGIDDAEKLVRVTATSANKYLENPTSEQDVFVVTRRNGPPVILGENILEPDSREGTNPIGTDSVTINNDGTATREAVTSSYKIVHGNGNEYIRTGYDENSGKEIKYSMYSPEENKYIDTELETNRTMPQDSGVRQWLNDQHEGTREAQDTENRFQVHEKFAEQEVEVEGIDNDLDNNPHEHNETKDEITLEDKIPNTDLTWEELASKLGYRGSDRLEKTVEKFEQECEENPNKENQEIIEDMEEEINEEYRGTLSR